MHSIRVVFDALQTVLGEIPQHFQRPHADGYVILVCPELHGNEHHACMELVFEDLQTKPRMERERNKETEWETNTTAPGVNYSLNRLRMTDDDRTPGSKGRTRGMLTTNACKWDKWGWLRCSVALWREINQQVQTTGRCFSWMPQHKRKPTHSIHKVHHWLGKISGVRLRLVSFKLRGNRKRWTRCCESMLGKTRSHTKVKWNPWVAFNKRTYHTVIADNHHLQIFHLFKYTARHLQRKTTCSDDGDCCKMMHTLTSVQPMKSVNNNSRAGRICCIASWRWDQTLTARFFRRFSQDKSSSSEKSCSSSAMKKVTRTLQHIQYTVCVQVGIHQWEKVFNIWNSSQGKDL